MLKQPVPLFMIASVIFGFFGMMVGAQASPAPPTQVTVLAEGLFNPQGLAALPNGAFLIAEQGTGNDDLSAGVSLMTPQGTIGRLISGIRSGRDSGDLSGVPLVAVAPDRSRIYAGNFAAGHLWTLPYEQALTLPDEPFTPDDLGTAVERFNNVILINPFDMTFDADGLPIISDASGNGVATEMPDGKVRFFHRFAPLQNPTNPNLTIDPVPTGIERVGDEYYVTLFGGCPYPLDSGALVAIDMDRNQRTVSDGLNMPIDIAQGPDGTLWVLEFARFAQDASCFSGSGYQPNTGRLSRLNPDGSLTPLLTDLDFPGALLPLDDGSLLVTEIFAGRLLHIAPDNQTPPFPARTALTTDAPSDRWQRQDPPPNTYDDRLAALIQQHNLSANPGASQPGPADDMAELGRLLFFDPILSGDQNIACSTCHHPAFGMADGRVLPIGAGGVGLGPGRTFADTITLAQEVKQFAGRAGRTHANQAGQDIPNPFAGVFVPRHSPTIINSALLDVQFWDGRVQGGYSGVETLENNVNDLGLGDPLTAQALFPIISLHEMAGATWGDAAPQRIRQALVQRLQANPAYVARFADVFGPGDITMLQLAEALAAFERDLIFTDAPWDAYIAGDTDALTPQQKRGALLFYGEVLPDVNCAACHSGDLFTDQGFHNILSPQIGPGKGHGDTGREDWGRAAVTFDRRDQYTFRTPSLRNVTLTAPYFHSGAYPTLRDAVLHHANLPTSAASYDPATYLPSAFLSSTQPYNPVRQLHSVTPHLIDSLPLTERDIDDLLAFMVALTDPQADDLNHLIPESVPSGLPLDAPPTPSPPPDRAISPAAALALAGRASAPGGVNTAVTDKGDWRFAEVASERGLSFEHGAFAQAVYQDPIAGMGAGLCWIDYDNDGWLDLYLVNSYAEDEYTYWQANGGLPTNALYRNSDGQFVDVSQSTGTNLALRGNGCIAADFNADGYPDLYITADGPNALLWNKGDGTFWEGAAEAGIGAPEWNSAAAAADLNGDGLLDLFVGGYIDLNNKVPKPIGAFPQDYYGIPDSLYISTGLSASGTVTYREVSREAGLFRDERALGAIFTDADNDGDLDLYIANDGQANRLYEYVPTDTALGFRYIDRHHTANVGDTGSGMGVASADYDGDGQFDLFVTNWEAELNALYLNQTQQHGYINFRYSTYRIGLMGLGNNMTGWGTALADFDHDGDADMLTVNGRVPVANLQSDPELIRFYGNLTVEGGHGQFREWTNLIGLDDVGRLSARGSAVADYDNDGDLDIAVNTIAGRAYLLENRQPAGAALQLALDRPQPGTVAAVTLPDGAVIRRELHIGSSYLASEDPRLHFGLGDVERVPQVRITYPDGTSVTYSDVPAGVLQIAHQHHHAAADAVARAD